MAKYFTGSNKNFHSTMYSDEEIYQLLGEKNTMIQQLAEVGNIYIISKKNENTASHHYATILTCYMNIIKVFHRIKTKLQI